MVWELGRVRLIRVNLCLFLDVNMKRHLELGEKLLCEERIAGVGICRTCPMDLDWEANHYLCECLDEAGDKPIVGT